MISHSVLDVNLEVLRNVPGIEHSGHPDVKIPVWSAFFKKYM